MGKYCCYFGKTKVTRLQNKSIGLHRFLRAMNYQLYPWLENLKHPSIIPFLQNAKQELFFKGVTTISNFITKEALENIRKESVEKGKVAYETDDSNVYLLSPNMDLTNFPDVNHIRNRQYKTHVASIAYDELNPENTLA